LYFYATQAYTMIILAVDDDSEDFEFFFDAVKEVDKSIIVLKASNGQEALHILENHMLMPDYIFLDINMPMMDGRACLSAIKKNEKLKDIPVVMYSTTSNQTEITQYKMMGANFLVKPNHFSKLVKSLAIILGYSDERSTFIFFLV
jgi:CheY-like chemotaxis protein